MGQTGTRQSRVLSDLRATWPQLAITDILYKIFALVVLIPMTAALLRWLISISGRTVLADEDLLDFFVRPLGWLSLVLIGGIILAILSLEQAALMTIVLGERKGLEVDFWKALLAVAGRAWSVLQVTAALVARVLLYAAPFLVVAGLTYWLLLTRHDINFYLAEKPPEYWWAVGVAGFLAVGLGVIIARRLIGWAFSLPLVIFDGAKPRMALEQSRGMVEGRRREVALWLVGWAVVSFVVSTLLTTIVVFAGRQLIPRLTGNLALFVVGLGLLLLVWGVVNLLTTLVSAALLATVIVDLYEGMGGRTALLDDWQGEVAGRSRSLKVSRGVAVAIVLVALTASAAIGYVLLDKATFEDRVQVAAHRGGALHAPENTLAAVERALEAGTDWVEIDVQETADDEVVVLHDSDLKKVAGVDLKIWDATWEELQEIDIGSYFAPEFSDQRVPRLQQVLELCRGRAGVVIELKYYGHNVRLEERVAEIVDAAEMSSDVVVMSLDYNGLKRMEALRPEWKSGLLTAVVLGDLTRLDVGFLAVNTGLVKRRFVRAAHRTGKDVFAWTVNDVLTMSAMMDLGVDTIITDDPQLAKNLLAQRAELSPVERLLAGLAVYFGGVKETPQENV